VKHVTTLRTKSTESDFIAALKQIVASARSRSYAAINFALDYDNTVIEGIQKINVIDWLLGKE